MEEGEGRWRETERRRQQREVQEASVEEGKVDVRVTGVIVEEGSVPGELLKLEEELQKISQELVSSDDT